MPINSKCKVELTHTSRPGKVLESTWGEVGWRYFNNDTKILKGLLKQLQNSSRASYTDKSGTLNIKLLGDINGS